MTAEIVPLRFRRAGKKNWSELEVLVKDPYDVLNVANRHFGDPLKNIGGPVVRRPENAIEARE